MEATSPQAWQPLTPRGVAAFASAPLRRLLLVQFCVALLAAAAIAWLLCDAYFPVIDKAIAQLPAEGEIRRGQLQWRGTAPAILAENRFLALSVDLNHSARLRSVAHMQIEFGWDDFRMHSLFGYAAAKYPQGWIIAANRQELEPRWGAWRPALVVGAMMVVGIGLFLSWFGLATLYAGPVCFAAFFLNREISWSGSWKFSAAAVLPGALLMVAGICLYVAGLTDLVQMSFIFAAHFLVGWVYSALSVFFLPKVASANQRRGNPFAMKARK